MKKNLDENGVLYLWGKVKSYVADAIKNKVDAVSGKGLSTNDLTDTLKTHYDAAYTHSQAAHAPTDAEANTIESITVNGKAQAPDSSKTVNIVIPDDTKKLDKTGDGSSVTVAFSAAASRTAPVTGDTLTVLFGKLLKAFSDTKTVAYSGSYNDLSNKPTIPTVPAISTDIESDAKSHAKTTSPKAVAEYVASRISSTYKPGGSITFAQLPALEAVNEGMVYNITEPFVTDARFVEGASKSYPVGTNVAVVSVPGGTYKFDVLPGFVDLSGYMLTSDLEAISNGELDKICV